MLDSMVIRFVTIWSAILNACVMGRVVLHAIVIKYCLQKQEGAGNCRSNRKGMETVRW